MYFRKFAVATLTALASFDASVVARLASSVLESRDLQESNPDNYVIDPLTVASAIDVDTSGSTDIASIMVTADHAATSGGFVASFAVEYLFAGCAAPSPATHFDGLLPISGTNDGTATFTQAGTASSQDEQTIIKIPLNVLRDLGGPTTVPGSAGGGTITPITIKFCLRFALVTDDGLQANSKEVDIEFVGSLDSDENWDTGSIVSIVPDTVDTGGPDPETYSVTTFPCDETCTFEDDATAGTSACTTTSNTITQNSVGYFCVRMATASLGKASITGIDSFDFTRASPSPVTQTAITNNIAQDLCEWLIEPGSPGLNLVKFSCNFQTAFFQDGDNGQLGPGTYSMTGAGTIELQLGTNRRVLAPVRFLQGSQTTASTAQFDIRVDEEDGFCSGGFWGLPVINFLCENILVPLFLGPIFNIKA